MAKSLYLECTAGISGDMAVAALLDLGADQEELKRVLESLPLTGYEVEISRVDKSGISCCDFDVKLEHDNHDHDMNYLHGHEAPQRMAGDVPHGSHGEHLHEHPEEGHNHADVSHHVHHHHEHRNLADILSIIDKGTMTDGARALSKRIFHIIAEAEAEAHGLPIDQVHFHEVGAVDSIVDIVSFAVCFDNLGIDRVYIPRLCEGTGTVRCQHGILPIPVPATANIAAAYHLPLELTDTMGEFVTPTGAAIAAAVMTDTVLPKPMTIERIGLGAGKRTYERPSILRAMLIRKAEGADDPAETDGSVENKGDLPVKQGRPNGQSGNTIWKLETNIDDSSGEALGYTMEKLLKAGARDVHYYPVFMKKNRPAWQLNVICTRDQIPSLETIIFRETTTIGIRRQEMERTCLDRRKDEVETPYGKVQVKICSHNGETWCYPEYDSVAEVAGKCKVSWQEVYRAAQNEGYKKLSNNSDKTHKES